MLNGPRRKFTDAQVLVASGQSVVRVASAKLAVRVTSAQFRIQAVRGAWVLLAARAALDHLKGQVVLGALARLMDRLDPVVPAAWENPALRLTTWGRIEAQEASPGEHCVNLTSCFSLVRPVAALMVTNLLRSWVRSSYYPRPCPLLPLFPIRAS